MKWFNQWLMPGAFAGFGVAVMAGWIRPGMLTDPGLRVTMGLVVVLFGVQRFVTSRMERGTRRPYGGWRPGGRRSPGGGEEI